MRNKERGKILAVLLAIMLILACIPAGIAFAASAPAAPVFSPSGGNISTSQTVTISNITAGDNAYYTINSGSTYNPPTLNSTPYNNTPFIVSSSAGPFTVEAAVYDSVNGWSSVTSATFTVSLANSGSSSTPSVQTESATSITANSAVLNGDVTSNNGYTVTDYGFLWGTSSGSLTNTLDVGANNNNGVFTDTLNNLTVNTTYYFEAYATNSYGTADGAVMSITTNINPDAPSVQTESATSITTNSAVLNGDVTSNNGYTVTDYGFLWGTSASSLTNTLDVGANNNNSAFTDTLNNLTVNTTYYFEAYATNSYGRADGAVMSFATTIQADTPSVQTEAAASITTNSAVLNGDVTSNNGYTVTDYGFLWGTSASSLTNTLDVGANNNNSAFTDTLSNLTASTTYYFEAYATNTYGTADGAVMSFTTVSSQTTTPPPSTTSVFSDVPSSFWGYYAISSLSSKGIVSGYPNGTFLPNANITRAEFASMLAKALALNTSGTTGTFTDVTAGDWFYGSVNAAASAGLVSGMGNNLFAPNALITREQMAVMVAKALGTKAPAVNGTELNAFSDSSTVDSWAVTSMEEAVKADIISGMTANTLAPLADATRAQAAVMIFEMLTVS